jgi:hypothetical protein
MSEEQGKDPQGDSEVRDTDEIFEDHPEMAPDESRISVGKVKDLEAESRKRNLSSDPVEDTGDRGPKTELFFARNQDFDGNEVEDRGKDASSPDDSGHGEDWSASPAAEGRRDLGDGLSAREDTPISAGPPAGQSREHKVWASILRRLGGGSPGSEENLQLADLFSRVQFPSDREGVVARLAPDAEFRLKEGIVVELKQAVEKSRTKTFWTLGDLVDCVKDELRRQEAEGRKLLRAV